MKKRSRTGILCMLVLLSLLLGACTKPFLTEIPEAASLNIRLELDPRADLYQVVVPGWQGKLVAKRQTYKSCLPCGGGFIEYLKLRLDCDMTPKGWGDLCSRVERGSFEAPSYLWVWTIQCLGQADEVHDGACYTGVSHEKDGTCCVPLVGELTRLPLEWKDKKLLLTGKLYNPKAGA